MPIEIRQDAPVSAELDRAARAFSTAALDALRQRFDNPENLVHRACKSMRSARAILKLGGKDFRKREYAEHDGVLRQAEKLLSPHCDAQVQLATVDELIERIGDPSGLASIMLREQVSRRLDIEAGSREHALKKAEALLVRLRAAIEPRRGRRQIGAKTAGKTLGHSFNKILQGLDRAENDISARRLHKLRKRAKEAREQLRLLRPLEPGRIEDLTRELDRLCDDLDAARDFDLTSDLLSTVAKNWPVGAALITELRREAIASRNKLVRKKLRRTRVAGTGSPRSIKRLIAKRWKPQSKDAVRLASTEAAGTGKAA